MGKRGVWGVRYFRFCLCFSLSNSILIGHKLNESYPLFKSNLLCLGWQLVSALDSFLLTDLLCFHAPCPAESVAGRASASGTLPQRVAFAIGVLQEHFEESRYHETGQIHLEKESKGL